MPSTLSALKNRIFGSIDDLEILSERETNFIKICLDGVKVNYRQTMPIPSAFKQKGKLPWYFYLKNHFKRLLLVRRRKSITLFLKNSGNRRVMIGFSNRTEPDEDGKHHSVYFDRILSTIGQEQCLLFGSTPIGSENIPELSLVMEDIEILFGNSSITSAQKLLLKDLWTVGKRIRTETRLTHDDYENYLCAAWIFFLQVQIWDAVFALWQPKVAFFDSHYHREGFIYAAKAAGIHLVELQHGLIAREDLFYILPPTLLAFRNQCMFADEILVYGDYWKNLLLEGSEYPEETIQTIGFYHFQKKSYSEADLQRQKNFKDKKILLVTTQVKLEWYFADYISRLAPRLENDWVIWVKPHPRENPEYYLEAFTGFDNVYLLTGGIDSLLAEAHLHLTSYSTTIFDALRHGKATWALMIETCRDYVERLENEGLVRVVHAHESVVDLASENKDYPTFAIPEAQFFFSPYTPSAILSRL